MSSITATGPAGVAILSAEPDAAPATAARAQVDVRVVGPAGSGKTTLLASLCRALTEFGPTHAVRASAALREVMARPASEARSPGPSADDGKEAELGEGPGEPPEGFTFDLDGGEDGPQAVRVRCEVSRGGPVNRPASATSVTVVCLNPFLCDELLAWKGFQNFVAVHQGRRVGWTLRQAVETAARTLLHLEPAELSANPALNGLLCHCEASRVVFDPARPPDRRLLWRHRNRKAGARLRGALYGVVRECVRRRAGELHGLRRELAEAPHAAVVLSHVDLIEALLPSVGFTDLERVFDAVLDGHPDRSACREIAARLLRVELAFADDGGRRGRPGVATSDAAADDRSGGEGRNDLGGLEGLGDGGGAGRARPGEKESGADAFAAAGKQPPAAARLLVGPLREDGSAKLIEYLYAVAVEAAEPAAKDGAPAPPAAPAPAAQAAQPEPSFDGAAERERTAHVLAEWRRQAQAAVADRDAVIEQLRRGLLAEQEEIARLTARATAAPGGALSSEERAARAHYETGRLGRAQAWALLLSRSVPALAAAAGLAFVLTRAAGGAGPADAVAGGAGKGAGQFLTCGAIALGAYGPATLFAVFALSGQVGPRWIWLRRFDARNRRLEVLTSGGEGISAPPDAFTLLRSPVLSLLGLGVIRRETGEKFLTSEPASWLLGPARPRVRWRVAFDLFALLALGGWVAALVMLSSPG